MFRERLSKPVGITAVALLVLTLATPAAASVDSPLSHLGERVIAWVQALLGPWSSPPSAQTPEPRIERAEESNPPTRETGSETAPCQQACEDAGPIGDPDG